MNTTEILAVLTAFEQNKPLEFLQGDGTWREQPTTIEALMSIIANGGRVRHKREAKVIYQVNIEGDRDPDFVDASDLAGYLSLSRDTITSIERYVQDVDYTWSPS